MFDSPVYLSLHFSFHPRKFVSACLPVTSHFVCLPCILVACVLPNVFFLFSVSLCFPVCLFFILLFDYPVLTSACALADFDFRFSSVYDVFLCITLFWTFSTYLPAVFIKFRFHPSHLGLHLDPFAHMPHYSL